jgi:hypothetical protein
MINESIIVGCGTIGASLALYLSKEKLISQLKIYDFDMVSFYNNQSTYPFSTSESGLSKIQIIKFLCKKLHPELMIHAAQEKIVKPFETNEFVIDCRDCKRPKINSKVRLSLDGHLLYIDSCKKQSDSKNYYRYIYPKDSNFIDAAIKIIADYLINDQYINHDLRLYNIKKSEQYILHTET